MFAVVLRCHSYTWPHSPTQIYSTVSHLIRHTDGLFAACEVYEDFVLEPLHEAFLIPLTERNFAPSHSLQPSLHSAKASRSSFTLNAIKLSRPQRRGELLCRSNTGSGCAFTWGGLHVGEWSVGQRDLMALEWHLSGWLYADPQRGYCYTAWLKSCSEPKRQEAWWARSRCGLPSVGFCCFGPVQLYRKIYGSVWLLTEESIQPKS